MSDSTPKTILPSSAASAVSRAVGILGALIGFGLVAQWADIGAIMQEHPKTTVGVASAAGALLYAWGLWTWHLWNQTLASRLRAKFDHDVVSDISIERAGKNKGRRVCTCCLHATPAQDYPLHDACGTGLWQCSAKGCGMSYRDAQRKEAEMQTADAARKLPQRDMSYSP